MAELSTELPIAACTLDPAALGAQGDRYRRLAAAAKHAQRAPDHLTVRFGDELDRTLLEQTLAIERGCCSFLAIAWDADERTLTIGVDDPSMAPALDALAEALGAASPAPAREARTSR